MPLFFKPGAVLHPFDARSVLLFASMAVSSAMAQTPAPSGPPASRLSAPASQSRLPLPVGQSHAWPGPRRPRDDP